MEDRSFVMERLSVLSYSLFSCAQHSEVISCYRSESSISTSKLDIVSLQSHHNSSTVLTIDLNVEEHLMSDNWSLLLFFTLQSLLPSSERYP